MKKWSGEFEKMALGASTYRHFLGLFFERSPTWDHPRPLSFQKFANLAGFSSKSFMNEIISGRRRLTLNSFGKISIGLRLPPAWVDFFRCLVALEEASFRTGDRDIDYYRRRLANAKKKVLNSGQDTWLDAESAAARLSLQDHVTDIHVCAGHPDVGASFEEIHGRIRIAKAVLQERLAKMVKLGLLRNDPETGRFHNGPPASNAKHTYTDPEYRDYISRAMARARARMEKPRSGQSLFGTQTFLVKESAIQALSNELNRVVREFADVADDELGDGLAEVLVTLTHNFDR